MAARTASAAQAPSRDTGRRTYLAQVVTPDAGKSLALYLQAQRAFAAEAATGTPPMRQTLVNRNIDALRRAMSPEQIAQAQAQAARWGQEWTMPGAAPVGATFSPDGGSSDIEPQACSD